MCKNKLLRIFCKIFLGEIPFWVGRPLSLLGFFERVENLLFFCCEFIIKTTTLQIHRWRQKHLEIYNIYIFKKGLHNQARDFDRRDLEPRDVER
jgi:hypothetical protein